MAGRGPAPKSKETRRNRTIPQRGDYVFLPAEPIDNPPGLPRSGSSNPNVPRGGWSAAAKREWSRWWSSPMAHMWDETDISNLELLLLLMEDFWAKPNASAAGQIRQMKDNLGLTPKGRQDRRWLLPDGVTIEEPDEDRPIGPGTVTKLSDRLRQLASD